MASFVVAPEVRYFICLANSYKRGGRCIAGIEIDSDNSIIYNKNGNPKWIRPIADTQYGEIPNDEAECIKLLSHVGLSNVEDNPRNVHREDVLYDSMELVSSKIFPQTKFLDKLVDKTHKSIFGNHGKAVSVDMASSLDTMCWQWGASRLVPRPRLPLPSIRLPTIATTPTQEPGRTCSALWATTATTTSTWLLPTRWPTSYIA